MGSTLNFIMKCRSGMASSSQVFFKVLKPEHTQAPDVVTVDKNAAYPVAMSTKGDETLAAETKIAAKQVFGRC